MSPPVYPYNFTTQNSAIVHHLDYILINWFIVRNQRLHPFSYIIFNFPDLYPLTYFTHSVTSLCSSFLMFLLICLISKFCSHITIDNYINLRCSTKLISSYWPAKTQFSPHFLSTWPRQITLQSNVSTGKLAPSTDSEQLVLLWWA